MAAILQLKKDEPHDINEPDHIRHAKSLVTKAVVGVVTYPLTFAKTLFQLGYEPYPLSTGRVFVFAGREAYFLPNALTYIRNVYREYGAWTLYRGAEAGFVGTLVGGTASYLAGKYLDTYYPEVGGEPTADGAEDAEDAHLAFRAHLRSAVREALAHTVGLVVQRPFTVLMVREIAQHIGGECKYLNVLSGVLRVGAEEGPAGLFSGLIPSLLTDYILIAGVHTLTYASGRLFLHLERQNADDKPTVEQLQKLRQLSKLLVPFVVNGWAYAYNVCGTVMAVTGSNLVVSLLPYAPLHGHWLDAYDYLKPQYGLTRGARLFLREQRGAVAVGPDHQLYASNKFFI